MTVPYQVVITDLIDDDLAPEREVLDGLAQVTALHARSEAELVGRIEQADAVILYHELALTAATIRRLERCRLIVRGGVGYDNVDRPLARELGIPITNVPDYGTEEVADSALAMLLSLVARHPSGQLGAAPAGAIGPTSGPSPWPGFAAECWASWAWDGSARRWRCAANRWAWTLPSMTLTSPTATTNRWAFAAWKRWTNCSPNRRPSACIAR